MLHFASAKSVCTTGGHRGFLDHRTYRSDRRPRARWRIGPLASKFCSHCAVSRRLRYRCQDLRVSTHSGSEACGCLRGFKSGGVDVDAILNELRNGRSPSLRRRRAIGTLAAIGLADFAIISLYQIGVIRHLPDPPGKIFASDKVNGSHKAYAMGLPDGTTGAGLYALLLMLASAGGSERSGRPPVFDLLLGGAVAAGAVGAAQYLYDMVRKQERACPYCIVGAVLDFAMVPFVVPEVRRSARALLQSSRR